MECLDDLIRLQFIQFEKNAIDSTVVSRIKGYNLNVLRIHMLSFHDHILNLRGKIPISIVTPPTDQGQQDDKRMVNFKKNKETIIQNMNHTIELTICWEEEIGWIFLNNKLVFAGEFKDFQNPPKTISGYPLKLNHTARAEELLESLARAVAVEEESEAMEYSVKYFKEYSEAISHLEEQYGYSW